MIACLYCGRPESAGWPYDDGFCGVVAARRQRIPGRFLRATEDDCAVATRDGRRRLAAVLRRIMDGDETAFDEATMALAACGADTAPGAEA